MDKSIEKIYSSNFAFKFDGSSISTSVIYQMASSFDFTVKIPCRFHNPWMSYNELCQYIQNYPPDLVIINNFNDICFYETVVKALKWEHN